MLRLRQRAEQRLPNPYTRLDLDGYLAKTLHANAQATRANFDAPVRDQASFTTLDLGFLQCVTATKTMHRHDHAYKRTAPAEHRRMEGDPRTGSQFRHVWRVGKD